MSFGFFTFSENSFSSLASSDAVVLSGVSAAISQGTVAASGGAVVTLTAGVSSEGFLGDESIILSPVIALDTLSELTISLGDAFIWDLLDTGQNSVYSIVSTGSDSTYTIVSTGTDANWTEVN
jgi:hypothetical protein